MTLVYSTSFATGAQNATAIRDRRLQGISRLTKVKPAPKRQQPGRQR